MSLRISHWWLSQKRDRRRTLENRFEDFFISRLCSLFFTDGHKSVFVEPCIHIYRYLQTDITAGYNSALVNAVNIFSFAGGKNTVYFRLSGVTVGSGCMDN